MQNKFWLSFKARNQQWVQSKATQPKQWRQQAKGTTTTQRTAQLLKQYKVEQQQAAKIRRMFWKHLRQSKGAKKGWRNSISISKPKMILEQTRCERRKLELEIQMMEVETKHQPLEERELERKVKRTALENDDVRYQSTSARKKPHFQLDPKEESCPVGRQPSNTRSINSSLRSNHWSEQA